MPKFTGNYLRGKDTGTQPYQGNVLSNIGSSIKSTVKGAGDEINYLKNSVVNKFNKTPNTPSGRAGLRGAGRAIPQGGRAGYIKAYKKGGKVNKTGLAYLHKGEEVLTKKETMEKALEKKKGKSMEKEC